MDARFDEVEFKIAGSGKERISKDELKKKKKIPPWAVNPLMQAKHWKWILVKLPFAAGKTLASPLYLGTWCIIHANRIYLF